ncbi:hypothetical protein [Mobilicoccus massiliensis]|uniref:hypothetical protein n=1 Tax=Mobilicoccus massiliensis TaxID=1522310 RepID=UPI00069400E7|nr:hypothetical protein [Mobilicoccus massiliensis]
MIPTIVLVVLFVVGGYAVVNHIVPGVGPQACRITVGGQTFSYEPEQAQNAATITAIGMRRKLPHRAVTIALATAMQESKLRNLDHGDRDSLGLFQQRPSQGWGTPAQLQDPVYATEKFYDHLVKVRGYLDRPLTEVAQDVQRSGFPDAYARHEERADLLMQVFTGQVPAAVVCRLNDAGRSGSAEETAAEMKAEFGISPAVSGRDVTGVLSSTELAWAAAHWSVAHAARTGATRVTVGDRTWTRSDGPGAMRWSPTDDAGPTTLTVSLRRR